MKKEGIITICVIAGLSVGGYFLFKKLRKKNEENEVVFEITRDVIEQRSDNLEEKEDEGIFVNTDPCIISGADDEDMHVNDSEFEFISMEEYENTTLNQMQLTLYSDGVLMGEDESEGPLDPVKTIGKDGFDLLNNSPYTNVLYIRNNAAGYDYEIVAVCETFRELREDE